MDNFTVQFKEIGLDEVTAKLAEYNAELKRMVHNTNGTVTVTGKVKSAQDGLADSTNRAASATDRAAKSQSNYFAHIAKTTIQSAIINKLFLEFVDVSDQAIKQVDLMNNFPATMASMGQSTENSTEAFKALSDYVGQVGGNLGDAASAVTRFTGVTNDVKSAVAIFQGLNNALIAGDSSMEEQRLAAMQFAQAFERGKPDMKEWMSLTTNMSQQLNLVAEEMGYVNADALGSALREGEESMGAFTTELTKMSTGTGPIAQQALARMQGMQFAFNVMKNTMVQGLAAIINAFGRANIVNFFSFLTQVITVVTQAVAGLIGALISLVNVFRGLLGMPPLTLEKDLGNGAEQALNLGDNLDNAKKKAKELNKSLASFDKMNVLPDKTGKNDEEEGAGGTKFTDDQSAALAKAFEGIVPKIQEASLAAKIFAGILGGIAAINIFKAIADSFNNFIETTDTAKKNVDRVKNSLAGDDTQPNIFQKMAEKARGLPVIVGGSFKTMGQSVSKFGKLLLTPVGSIVAIGVAIGILYTTNEDFKKGFDSVWNPIIEVLKEVGRIIGEGLVLAFQTLVGWIEKLGIPISLILPDFDKLAKMDMEQLGKSLGGLAVIIGGVLTLKLLFAIAHFIVLGVQGAASAVAAGVAWVIQSAKIIAAIAVTVASGILQFIRLGIAAVAPAVAMATQWAFHTARVIAGFALTTAAFLIQLGIMTAALAVNAIKMAASWLIAMGPIGWAIIAVAAFVALVIVYWEDIKNAFAAAWTWITEMFSAGVEWLQNNFIKPIGEFFVGLWNGIVEIWKAFDEWITGVFTDAWNGIVAVWNAVIGWFQDLWWGIQMVFIVAGVILSDFFREAWEGIQAVWNVVVEWFRGIWNGITGIFNGVKTWFGNKFKEGWDAIKAIFNDPGAFFGQVWERIKSIFGSVGSFFGDVFKGAFNGVAGLIEGFVNNAIGLINKLIAGINKVTSKVGGPQIPELPKATLPRLARGGIVEEATIAMIGENGREAVVPLENNTEWIDKLAAKINSNGGGDGRPVQLVVQIGEEKIVTKVIDLINEKTQMSGRNKILV